MGMTGVEEATTEVWCRVGRKGVRARRMDSRKTPSVLPAVPLLSFPQVFSGNPSSGESRRSGHDKASRMTEERKDAGCPITTVGHDSERCLPHLFFPSGSPHLSFPQSPLCPSRSLPSVLPAVPLLSFPPVFSGNPSSGESRRSGHDRASRMTGKRKDAGCPITTVGHDRERGGPRPSRSFPSVIPAGF